ncbi:Alpha/Beta hydrolase protein [Aspergillus multicolor]|uniref:Alpha/Beta hydrolase protein n=1 Tax=Aspergillus multicolor TaxID=41759 RepID=UPI003CCDC9A6
MSISMSGKHSEPPLKEDVAPPSSIPRPPLDPAFAYPTIVAAVSDTGNTDLISTTRSMTQGTTADDILQKFPNLEHTEHTAPGLSPNQPGVTLPIFQSKESSTKSHRRPVLYHTYGGGQIAGNRFMGLDHSINLFIDGNIDAVHVGVEYRLAPEHRAPAAAYDCYAGLVYLANHAEELGIDAPKILMYAGSGGAAPAAAACILARNREHPAVRAQMLSMPMLDDRHDSVSAKQFEAGVAWSVAMNRVAWDHVLGRGAGDSDAVDVDELMAPARATDLSGLPPAFIDVGECEVFWDEAVVYASRIWQCGGTAELHVWPGSYRGMFPFEPEVPVARAAIDAQRSYIWRLFGGGERNLG